MDLTHHYFSSPPPPPTLTPTSGAAGAPVPSPSVHAGATATSAAFRPSRSLRTDRRTEGRTEGRTDGGDFRTVGASAAAAWKERERAKWALARFRPLYSGPNISLHGFENPATAPLPFAVCLTAIFAKFCRKSLNPGQTLFWEHCTEIG